MGLAFPTGGSTGIASPSGGAGGSAAPTLNGTQMDPGVTALTVVDPLGNPVGTPNAATGETVVDSSAEWVEEYRSAPSGWTAQNFLVNVTAFADDLGVQWTPNNNTVTATAHAVGGANGYEFAGTNAAEVYIRAALADLVEAGGGPAYALTDDVLVVVKREGVDLSGDPGAHVHTRIEWAAASYRPRVESILENVAGTVKRHVLVEDSAGTPDLSAGTNHTGASYWTGMRVVAGTAFPRYSATEITLPTDGSVWDGGANTARQPRVDDDETDLVEPYVRIGGYSYTSASPAVTWRVTEIVVYRLRAVAHVPVTINATSLNPGERAITVKDTADVAVGVVTPATGNVIVSSISESTPTSYSLDPANWNQANTTDWTLALMSGKLRATYAGSGSPDHDAADMSACYLIWPTPVRAAAVGRLRAWLVGMLHYDEPTANGIGVGIGFVDHATVPTDGVFFLADRASAGNVTLRMNGEVTALTVNASVARTGALLQGMLGNKTNAASWDGAQFDPVTGEISADTSVGDRGGAISGLGQGENVYLAIAFIADLNAGYVEVTDVAADITIQLRIDGV